MTSVQMNSERPPGVWNFVRNPSLLPPPARNERLAEYRNTLGLCFVVGLASLPVLAVAQQLSGATSELENFDLAELAFAAILVAPLLEELTFRSYVSQFHVLWLILTAGGIALFVPGFGIWIAVAIAVVCIVPHGRRMLAATWGGHFRWVVYGSALAFGLVHSWNWVLPEGPAAFALLPLLVLPQTLLGLVLAYARVRLGLIGAILIHAAYNAAFVGLTLVSTSLGPDVT